MSRPGQHVDVARLEGQPAFGCDPPNDPAWPTALGVTLDRGTQVLANGTLLLGGVQGQAVKLSTAGTAALHDLLDAGPVTPTAGRLARRLVAAGLAHPVPPAAADVVGQVSVVIPVLERPEELRRCLAFLTGPRVIVVDDGSKGHRRIAQVCDDAGAQLVRLPHNQGPSAARNAGLAQVTTPLVAFVDSDVDVRPGWLEGLLGHFMDPAVAVVAPRVTAVFEQRAGVLGRYGTARFTLDMGERAAIVQPYGRVGYLPSAAIVCRVAALSQGSGGAFDPDLWCGEDVDLVWRVIDRGWTVRYDPTVSVRHHEPTTWPGLLRRRCFYGTSVAGLAVRHPERVAHLRTSPIAAGVVGATATGHPLFAAALAGATAARLARKLAAMGAPPTVAVRLTGQSILGATTGLARACTMLAWPALGLLALGSRRRALAALAVMTVPPLLEWAVRRPDLDPLRWTVASITDDLVYGVGVVGASVKHRNLAPLRPRLS